MGRGQYLLSTPGHGLTFSPMEATGIIGKKYPLYDNYYITVCISLGERFTSLANIQLC